MRERGQPESNQAHCTTIELDRTWRRARGGKERERERERRLPEASRVLARPPHPPLC